jgi:hypothetical protein
MREYELPSLDHSKERSILVSEQYYMNINPKRGGEVRASIYAMDILALTSL